MISVVISIGSNCGNASLDNRHDLISNAIAWLKSILIQTSCSQIYETPDAKDTGHPYLNAVMKGVFQGTGIQLQEVLKEKELEMGRTAECRKTGLVPIDMDIVICDGAIWKPWDARQKFFRLGFSQIS